MICKNLLLLLLHARLYFTEGQADGVERVDFVKSESVSSIGVRGNHQESRNSRRQEDRELQSGMNFVVNFDLYDATLDAKVGNLTNGAVINLRELGISSPSALNIEAVVKGKTRPGSVKVFMEKFKYKQIQTLPPYTLCGISRKDYKQCTKLSLGTHTVQATVYSRTRARGSTLVVKTLSFTIVNDMPKPPTSGPTRSPTHLPTSSQIRSPTHKPTIAPTGSPTSMPAPPSVTCKIPMLSATWEKWTEYPIPIAESQGAMVGNHFFVVSGFSRNFSAVTEKVYGYDTMNPNATWVSFDDIPVAGFSHAATAVDGLLMYICGSYVGQTPGPDSDICLRFSPTSPAGSQWSQLPNMPISRGGGGLVHSKATNTLLVATGATRRNGKTVDHNDTYEFDLTTQIWTRRPDIPYKANHVSHVTATFQGKQRHFILGGQVEQDEANGNQKDNYEWDAINKVWIKRADLVPARGHASASTVAYGCGFLIIGGAINGVTTRLQTSDVSYYAIDTDTWTKIGDLPKAMNTPVCDIVRFGGGDDWVYCQTGAVANKFAWRTRISQN